MVRDALVIETREPVDFSVIWLHGLGADGHDFEPIIPELNLPPTASIRFVFPHAPVRPVTINGGMRMRAWYDVVGFSPEDDQDSEGMLDSAARIREIIAQEQAQGIKAGRILLAGFSQGGAIALLCGMQFPEPLAGILALSTYMPLMGHPQLRIHSAQKKTPVLMMHGEYDPVISPAYARNSYHYLLDLGLNVQWRQYPMEHSVCHAQMQDIGRWIADILKNNPEEN